MGQVAGIIYLHDQYRNRPPRWPAGLLNRGHRVFLKKAMNILPCDRITGNPGLWPINKTGDLVFLRWVRPLL